MRNDLNSNSFNFKIMNNIVELKNVTKIYQPGNQPALQDVSFTVREGEFLCLIGPSGEGKSTTLKLIAGLEKPTSGDIARPAKVAMVFQTVALFPWLTVLDNVLMALEAEKIPKAEAHKIAMKHIEMMKLSELVDKRPAELSGGQRQRVGIARALAVDPHVLLLDEPFSALDPKTTAELHDDLIGIWRETKKTIIMVSHLIEEAVSLAERIILIKKYHVADTFDVTMPYPRREQEAAFMHDVQKIRKEFFK
jgi:NitT/TauT family transport system ATP-binding protein